MLRRIWTTNLAALASVFFLSLQHPVFAQVQPRITAPVDDSVRVAVRGSTPAIHGALDLGAIQDGTPLDHLLLILSMSDKQQNEAITLLDSQQTRGSAHYHEWLTPEEFGLRFGPAPQDIKAITAWLGTQGLRINTIARSGLWIDFSGTAGQVKRAFGTSMHTYRVGNGNYIANAGEVSIPAALSPAIRGIASLNNFYRRRPLHAGGVQVRQTASGTYEPIPGQTVAAGPNGPVNFLSPGDFAKIYDLNPLYQGNIAGRALDGTGQSIAIVSRSDINLQDVADFRSLFGLPAGTPSVINVGPDVPFNPQNGDAVEAALDVEWAGAVAPGANIQMVVAGSTLTDGVDLSAAYIVDNDLAPIVSVSFGACERALGPAANQFYSALWQQAAAQGMSVFVASGDAGAAGCDQPTPLNFVVGGTGASQGLAVSGLASTPFTTTVGGTQFNEAGAGESPSPGTSDATFWAATNGANSVNALGYIPEKVWNESCITPPPAQPGSLCFMQNVSVAGIYVLQGGGGGLSTIYPPPGWQTLAIPGLSGSNFLNRALPDVSLSADPVHDPYLLCFNGGCSGTSKNLLAIGGTSASAPSFAGIMAMVDQAAGSPQGLANYVLYPLATQENFTSCNSNAQINPAQSNSCVFHDTTLGNNGQPGNDISNIPVTGATGYPATAGYDAATGLGSVDAANLVASWLALQQGFQGTNTTFSTGGTAITGTHGSAVPVTVNVNADSGTGAPSGDVAFIAQGGTLAANAGLGNGTLTAGTGTATFTGSLSDFPGGSYNLIARYPGDGVFASSSSAPIPVTISPESSATSLTMLIKGFPGPVSSAGIGYGQQVDLDATVQGASGQGIATGTLSLSQNGTQVSSLPLDSLGHALWLSCPLLSSPLSNTLPCLTPGSYSLTVNYSGDNSFTSSPQPPSSSQTVLLDISKTTPPFLLFATNPRGVVVLNQPFKLLVFVDHFGGAQPTGTVVFAEGSTSLGRAAIAADGTASVQVNLPQGTHPVTAAYSGDSNWNPLTSTGQIEVGVPFGFTIPEPTQTIPAGGTATYNLTLSAAPGVTGDVTLTCGSSNAPAGTTCEIPSSISFTSSTTSVPVTVKIGTLTTARLKPTLFTTWPLAFGAVLLSGVILSKRRNLRRAPLPLIAAFLVASMGACGGSSNSPPPPTRPPTIVSFTIAGSIPTSANTGINEFATLTLKITH